MDERTQIQELFEACVDLSTSERERYLLEYCPSDAIRARVHQMLRTHDDTDGAFGLSACDKFRELLNAPGETIGDFEIIREAGRGGMSLVYLARDTVLDREVALKVLGADRSLSETSKQRFLHEARAAASLNHPNIIKVFRYGETDRHGFIAMEYIPDGTYDRWLANRDKETNDGRREIVRVIESIAEALESAHRAGVIHRDVKPTNILMDAQGRPYLADFGIARVTESIDPRETLAGAGTAAYMSPEQIAAVRDEIDHRSDIFSLGVVLYESLVGQLPFKGCTGEEIKDSICKTDPAKPRSIIRSLPRDLEVICRKAMEKNPNDRYPSSGHMAADLRAWAEGRPILARSPSALARTIKSIRKYRYASIIAIATACGGLTGASILLKLTDNRPRIETSKLSPNSIVSYSEIHPITRSISPRTELGRGKQKTLKLPSNGFFRISVQQESGTIWEVTKWLDPNESFALPPSPDELITEDGMAYIESKVSDSGYVIVPAFWIDKFEVSNGEYKEFLDRSQYPPPEPSYWSHKDVIIWRELNSDLWDSMPVVDISYSEAQMYAQWRGKRLPTLAEWDHAARGNPPTKYAWGNEYSHSSDNDHAASHIINWHSGPEDHPDVDLVQYPSSAVDVKSMYLELVWGRDQEHDDWTRNTNIANMMGNVAEWTESIQDKNLFLIRNNFALTRSRPFSDLSFHYAQSRRAIGIGFRCARTDFEITGEQP